MKTLKFLTVVLLSVLIGSCAVLKATPKQSKANGNNQIRIKIQLLETATNDTLALWQSCTSTFTENFDNGHYKKTVSTRGQDGWFIFNLVTEEPLIYIMVAKLKQKKDLNDYSDIDWIVIPYYIAEAGDQVQITINRGKVISKPDPYRNMQIKFNGAGSLKYQLRYEADSAAYFLSDTSRLVTTGFAYNNGNSENKRIEAGLHIFTRHKAELNKPAYDLLTTDFVSNIKFNEALRLQSAVNKKLSGLNDAAIAKFLTEYDSVKYLSPAIPLYTLLLSRLYIESLLCQARLSSLMKHRSLNNDSLYIDLKKNYIGLIREKLIWFFFEKNGSKVDHYNDLLNDGLRIVKSPVYLNELSKYKNMMSGQDAFKFDLPDTSGKRVRLDDFKGKIIFLDFWFTGCINCINFYKNDLSKVEEQFRDNPNVVFVTVCIDKSKDRWVQSIRSGKYTSRSAVNLFTEGEGTENYIINKYKVKQYPQPIIIDKDQRLVTLNAMDLKQSKILIDVLKKLDTP